MNAAVITNDKYKNMPAKEKKKLVKRVVHAATKAQKDLIRRYDKAVERGGIQPI